MRGTGADVIVAAQLPLKAAGLQYCGSWPEYEERPQLYHDPQNVTLGIVSTVLEEMSGLFPDEYFNLGADEIGTVPFHTRPR